MDRAGLCWTINKETYQLEEEGIPAIRQQVGSKWLRLFSRCLLSLVCAGRQLPGLFCCTGQIGGPVADLPRQWEVLGCMEGAVSFTPSPQGGWLLGWSLAQGPRCGAGSWGTGMSAGSFPSPCWGEPAPDPLWKLPGAQLLGLWAGEYTQRCLLGSGLGGNRSAHTEHFWRVGFCRVLGCAECGSRNETP